MRHTTAAFMPIATMLSFASLVETASASTPSRMMAECRSYAGKALGARLPDIETKYEGQRTDRTHAVNGTARVASRIETFQCTFNPAGTRVTRFVVNRSAFPAPPFVNLPGQASPAESACISAVAGQVNVPAMALSVRQVSRGFFVTKVIINVPAPAGLAPWQCDYSASRVRRVMYVGRG
jgi:hypothetical protein